MSADNGVYILKTPARPIKNGNYYEYQHDMFEYRVAHCQAIENVNHSDLYLPVYFANSKVYPSHVAAMVKAVAMAKEITDEGMPLEYGIQTIDKECFFPNMSAAEANRALDTYVLGEDERYPHEKHWWNIHMVDTDITLCFPSGKKVTLQWRVETGSMDVCLPDEEVNVITWKGFDMEPSVAHKDYSDGHVRHCGQLVLELGESYMKDEENECSRKE